MSGGEQAESRVASGLEGVVVSESTITLVDGSNGELWFRGYNVRDFADKADYLAVVHLLWHERWPTAEEQAAFERRLRARRALPPPIQELLRQVPARGSSPMAVVRTAVSLLGMLDPDADATTREAVVDKATTVLATMPTLVAALGRRMRGEEPVAPDPELGHAANYLYMLRGARPSADEAAGLSTLMTLHCEHELNASTFTARTVIGTLSDYYSALVSAIAALKGPRHGGALDEVMTVLREIGRPEAVPAYVERALAQKRRLPGFGHRVYRKRDPRAPIQAAIVRRLAERSDAPGWFEVAARLEQEMQARKRLPANVDYYAGVALHYLGFPTDLFTGFMASARVAGWTAHILEQYADNRLIRPRAQYRGPRGLAYPPAATNS
jgi:citrate synthase